MALFKKEPAKEKETQERISEWLKKFREGAPEKKEMPVQKEEKKDTSIFGGKPYLPTKEVIWKFRKKVSPYIPGAGGAMYTEKERVEIVNKVKEISKKFGSQYYLRKDLSSKIIREFEKEKWKAKTGTEKRKIDRQIRFLKRELLGK